MACGAAAHGPPSPSRASCTAGGGVPSRSAAGDGGTGQLFLRGLPTSKLLDKTEAALAHARRSLLRRVYAAWGSLCARHAIARKQGLVRRAARFFLLWARWQEAVRLSLTAAAATAAIGDGRRRRVLHTLRAAASGEVWMRLPPRSPAATVSLGTLPPAEAEYPWHTAGLSQASEEPSEASLSAVSGGRMKSIVYVRASLPPKALDALWHAHLRRRALRAWQRAGAAAASIALAAAARERTAAGFRLRLPLVRWSDDAADWRVVGLQWQVSSQRRGLRAIRRAARHDVVTAWHAHVSWRHWRQSRLRALRARCAQAAATRRRIHAAEAFAALKRLRRVAAAAGAAAAGRARAVRLAATADGAWQRGAAQRALRAGLQYVAAVEAARAERRAAVAAAAALMRQVRLRAWVARWCGHASVASVARAAGAAAASQRTRAAAGVRMRRSWRLWHALASEHARLAHALSHHRLVRTRIRRAAGDVSRAIHRWGARALAHPLARQRWADLLARRSVGGAVRRWRRETGFRVLAREARCAADAHAVVATLGWWATGAAVNSRRVRAEEEVASGHAAAERHRGFGVWVRAAAATVGLQPVASHAMWLVRALWARRALSQWAAVAAARARAAGAVSIWRRRALCGASADWRTLATAARRSRAADHAALASGERWWRLRLLGRLVSAWSCRVRLMAAARTVQMRGEGGVVRALLCAWRAHARKRRSLRDSLVLMAKAVRRRRAERHVRAWRRGMAVAAAARQLARSWIENVALRCWHAMRVNALRGRAAAQGERREEEAMRHRLGTSAPLRDACQYAIARWVLLLVAAVLRTWRDEVRRRRLLRPLLSTLTSRQAAGLAARAFRGWAEAVWYAQLMRRCRADVKAQAEAHEDALILP